MTPESTTARRATEPSQNHKGVRQEDSGAAGRPFVWQRGYTEGEPCIEGGCTPSANHDGLTPSATGFSWGECGLVGEDLESYDCQPDFGEFVAKAARLRIQPDLVQTWRVGADVLSVSFRLDRQRYIYFLRIHEGWPEPPAPPSLALAEVYAIAVTGELRELGRGEFPRWKRRALAEAGLIEPPESSLSPLPPEAPPFAVKTWDAIAGVVGIRRLTEPPGTPVPLSAPWLARWSGHDEKEIRAGKRWLERHRFIEHVADHHVGKGRPLYLWAVAGDDSARRDEGSTTEED